MMNTVVVPRCGGSLSCLSFPLVLLLLLQMLYLHFESNRGSADQDSSWDTSIFFKSMCVAQNQPSGHCQNRNQLQICANEDIFLLQIVGKNSTHILLIWLWIFAVHVQ